MRNPHIAEASISRYPNSYDSSPNGTLTLTNALLAIRTGRYRSQVERVRQILAREGKRAYDKAKANLPAFTFGGTFAPKRGIAYLQQHSGIVHGDLDHLDDLKAMKHAICSDSRTVYCFISPSGEGLKLGAHVVIVVDDAGYKHAWQVVSKEYEQQYGGQWDPSGKDISRLCYVSYDPELYWNPGAVIFAVSAPTPHEPPHPPRRPIVTPQNDYQDYAERAIQTAVQMIQTAQLGTRHDMRLKAARLLGGYVAGGLLNDEHAYSVLAQALVGHTEDLPKALKTVEDGIAYGKAYPITLDALEAERQAWLDTHMRHRSRQVSTPTPEPEDHSWEGIASLPLRPFARHRGLSMGGRQVRHG